MKTNKQGQVMDSRTFHTPTKTRSKSPFPTSNKFAHSDIKHSSTDVPSAIDLLLLAYRRQKQLKSSPKPISTPSSNFVQSVSQRELMTCEQALTDSCTAITVKLLNQLKGHTLPSSDLEKVFFAFVTLFAELDASIEVGPNGKVLGSRAWQVVQSYLQSPGQAVQTARKFQAWVKAGKITKLTVGRTMEILNLVSEEGLRTSAKGDVGLPVYRYLKSGLDYYQAYTRVANSSEIHITPRKSPLKSPISPQRQNSFPMVSVSSLTPVETESDQAADSEPPRHSESSEHVKDAPSFGSGAFEITTPPAKKRSALVERRKSHLQAKLSRSKSHDDVRRSHSVLEVAVDWELDSAYRSFLKEKMSKSEVKLEGLKGKEAVLEQFRGYLRNIPALQSHFSSPIVQTRIAAFVDRVKREDSREPQRLSHPGK